MNTNTVLRALREFRDQGLLEFRRGRGITVAGAPDRGIVVAQAQDLVRLARRHGYRMNELIEIIEQSSWRSRSAPGRSVPPTMLL